MSYLPNVPTPAGSSAKPPLAIEKIGLFLIWRWILTLYVYCVQHNPYQLGKNQWTHILADMKEAFSTDFLLRTLKERTNKLIEKYTREELQYKTATEEDVTELGNLLFELTGIIESSSISINSQSDADVFLLQEQCNTQQSTSTTSRPSSSKTSLRNEKEIADMERDEYLNNSDMAPGPKSSRKRRNYLHPEDELIKLKQEQDHEIELKRLKLEEKKLQMDYELQEKLSLEKQKLEFEKLRSRMIDEENKHRNEYQTLSLELQKQTNELFLMFIKNKEK